MPPLNWDPSSIPPLRVTLHDIEQEPAPESEDIELPDLSDLPPEEEVLPGIEEAAAVPVSQNDA